MHAPSVIETVGRSSRAFDLPTKLLQDRIVYLGDAIDSDVANIIIMQLLWLQSNDPDADIDLYINSPGGSVYAGLAIKDIIDKLTCKVNTVGTGMCASMGAYLLSAGTGVRRATKNCRVMIHSVSAGTVGVIHDMKVDYEEAMYLHNSMMDDIVKFSNGKLTREEIDLRTARDHYLNVEEAIKLGLVDQVV